MNEELVVVVGFAHPNGVAEVGRDVIHHLVNPTERNTGPHNKNSFTTSRVILQHIAFLPLAAPPLYLWAFPLSSPAAQKSDHSHWLCHRNRHVPRVWSPNSAHLGIQLVPIIPNPGRLNLYIFTTPGK